MTRRSIAVVSLICLCAVGTACGKDKGKDAQRSLIELRPVLSSNPPPCATKAPKKTELVLPRSTDGKVAECLELGTPIVDARDVRSATVAEDPSQDPALSIVLGGVGSANLDGFAQRNQGKRLAIVADGQLVSAPEVHFTSFAGRIQVSGLSKEKTDDLFRRLNALIKS